MLQPLLPYSPDRDVYRLLGVPANASTDEITAACRRLARTFHPDRNMSERATAEMQVVNAVRTVMSDPRARAIYDRERYRFHTQATTRPSTPRPLVRPLDPRPAPQLPSPPSRVGRYVRAVYLGLQTVARSLAPPRCNGCRTVISGDDAYCAACGTPLLTGS
ncbi:MAG TPA: J domain-containing protein [Candidatus Limnocylindria bacterium]|nr:J domain-containing protein [Candidatus Limnocylindria bacterium]